MWACLVGMAATAQDLNTVEVAYAAINEVCVYTIFSYVAGNMNNNIISTSAQD